VKQVRTTRWGPMHNREFPETPDLMQIRIFVSCLVAVIAAFTQAKAADLPPNVLAKNHWMELTRADYDAAIARVPEKLRFEFQASPKRLQALLNNMLVTKTLAAQARVHGTKPLASFR